MGKKFMPEDITAEDLVGEYTHWLCSVHGHGYSKQLGVTNSVDETGTIKTWFTVYDWGNLTTTDNIVEALNIYNQIQPQKP